MARARSSRNKSLVLFRVGTTHYAISIFDVREVTSPLAVSSAPDAPAGVLGVADYRGRIVPVVDLRERFGVEVREGQRQRPCWIVVDARHGSDVALVVDAVSEVFGDAESLEVPDLGPATRARGVSGIVRRGEGLVFVLDPGVFGRLASGAEPPEALR